MVKFGGKTADSFAEKTSGAHHKVLNKDQVMRRGAGYDPLPTPESLSKESQEHIASVFGDQTMWFEQSMEEFAAFARKVGRLYWKLRDPALDESPSRPAAARKLKGMQQDLRDMACLIATHEATCDRYWQVMDPKMREWYQIWWKTDADNDRLIGIGWKVFAPRFQWPRGFALSDVWFKHNLDPYLLADMEKMADMNMQLGEVIPDPFEDDTDG